MNKIKKSSKCFLIILAVLAVLCFIFYLLPIGGSVNAYLLKLRFKKMAAYILVAIIASLSTISFQTVTGNRFLTPSVLGLERLYVFMQSIYLFFFWRMTQSDSPNAVIEFITVMAILLGFFLVLQPAVGKLLNQGFGTILLICMSLGTLFSSLSTYMQVVMDPNEYDKLQSKLFASFQHSNSDVIWIVAALVLIFGGFLYRKNAILNTFYLGTDGAKLLGVDVLKLQRQVLWSVVILTAASTAMIGPLTFFGFIVVNLTYQLIEDYQHKWLFSASTLLGFIILIIGQVIIERIFHYTITISMVVELVGGAFFFYLLYKERIKK